MLALVSLVGLIIIVSMIVIGRLKFLDLWRDTPWSTLGLCGILGCQFGMVLVGAWYWVPAVYIPDQAMIERIKAVECRTTQCEAVVNDLLDRVNNK